jgi:hypothetical protein
MVAVDEPRLPTVVQRDEANRALRVKNGIPLDPLVGLYIQSHLRSRLRPLEAATDALFGVDVVECSGWLIGTGALPLLRRSWASWA